MWIRVRRQRQLSVAGAGGAFGENAVMRSANENESSGRQIQQAGGAREDWNSVDGLAGALGCAPVRRALMACKKKATASDWGWAHWVTVTARPQPRLQQLASRI